MRFLTIKNLTDAVISLENALDRRLEERGRQWAEDRLNRKNDSNIKKDPSSFFDGSKSSSFHGKKSGSKFFKG